MSHRRNRERGQSLIEFALVAPIFVFLLLISLQLALLTLQSYSVKQVTRSTARWLAINPSSTDAAVLAHARSVAMPLMTSAGFVSVTPSPACPSLSGGVCANRGPGSIVTVEIVYDVTSSIFLPDGIHLGAFNLDFPTQLAPYQVSVLVE
jgi:Flp pilus assembly protein TadG